MLQGTSLCLLSLLEKINTIHSWFSESEEKKEEKEKEEDKEKEVKKEDGEKISTRAMSEVSSRRALKAIMFSDVTH